MQLFLVIDTSDPSDTAMPADDHVGVVFFNEDDANTYRQRQDEPERHTVVSFMFYVPGEDA